MVAESQVPIQVTYDGEVVGEVVADVLVEGIILNFAETTVEVKRKVRDLKTLDQQD